MQNVIICLTYDTCTMCKYILSDEQKISIVLPEESVSWWCQWGPQGIYKGLSTRNAIIVQAKYFWRSLVENDTDACSAEQGTWKHLPKFYISVTQILASAHKQPLF